MIRSCASAHPAWAACTWCADPLNAYALRRALGAGANGECQWCGTALEGRSANDCCQHCAC